MTFKDYLATPHAWTPDQLLFVQDALADRNLPHITSWEGLRSYMPRPLNNDLREEAHFVWEAYQAAVDPDLPV